MTRSSQMIESLPNPGLFTCGIPAEVGHIEKWQLALDMIDETRSWGIDVPLVVADGGYGDTAAFRLGLEERGLTYAVGISTTTTAHPESETVSCADQRATLLLGLAAPCR